MRMKAMPTVEKMLIEVRFYSAFYKDFEERFYNYGFHKLSLVCRKMMDELRQLDFGNDRVIYILDWTTMREHYNQFKSYQIEFEILLKLYEQDLVSAYLEDLED